MENRRLQYYVSYVKQKRRLSRTRARKTRTRAIKEYATLLPRKLHRYVSTLKICS